MKLISWGPSKNCAPSLIQNLAVLAFEAVNPKGILYFLHIANILDIASNTSG